LGRHYRVRKSNQVGEWSDGLAFGNEQRFEGQAVGLSDSG